MLSKKISSKMETLRICLHDKEELKKGEVFEAVVIAEPKGIDVVGPAKVVGFGGRQPILKNNGYYIKLSGDGYGRKDGVLYALRADFVIACDEVGKEYERVCSTTPTGTFVAMRLQAQKTLLEQFITLEER